MRKAVVGEWLKWNEETRKHVGEKKQPAMWEYGERKTKKMNRKMCLFLI